MIAVALCFIRGSQIVVSVHVSGTPSNQYQLRPTNEDPRHWGTSVQFIAVTGTGNRELTTFKGAGFLGAHLVELLLREEHDVVVLDSFLTSQPSDLDHLATHPRLRVIR